MLKERKIERESYIKGEENYLGFYNYPGFYTDFDIFINLAKSKEEINHEDYYLAEITGEGSISDGHSTDYGDVKGVLMAFNLNLLDTTKYLGIDVGEYLFDQSDFLNKIRGILSSFGMVKDIDIRIVSDKGYLSIVVPDIKLDDNVKRVTSVILEFIRDYFEEIGAHITRMFGSYIMMANVNKELKAFMATDVPVEYCPLMIKLLREVGGKNADRLLLALKNKDKNGQKEALLELINEVVIKGGYFDTSRPLNSCEANVLFGASETMASAFSSGLIDASVIVSNNLGTIITTNSSNTQGAVKRMTGLFYTSPSKEIVETAIDAGIIPVFPYTAEIDQLEGVKKAIELGYKSIAVSVAANDNYLHEQLKQLEEKTGVTIYKFGLCATGISEDVAKTMRDNADIVWSCASRNVREFIEPASIAQVGIKIPVYIMTSRGFQIVNNHLHKMNEEANNFMPVLTTGDDRPVFINDGGMIRELKKKDVRVCSSCPHPCV